jgi:hypothetical protein
MRARSWLFAVALFALASCHDESGFPGYSVVDSFDDCRVGAYFASCGDGAVGPVLGCEPNNGGCWWFDTKSVPREIVGVSSCPADDICCENNWPFADDGEVYSADELFLSMGSQPWDRTREMNLDVVVDPSLPTPAATTVSCTGGLLDEPGAGPCVGSSTASEQALDTPAIAVEGPGNLFGWYPVVEVDETDEGGLGARICLNRYTDTHAGKFCPDSAAECAGSGTITIAAWPLPSSTGAPFHVDATFGNGGTLVVDGVVTSIRPRP